ncbi:hypothetical protein PPERSA_07167 [Pseudocohnilembus persalinus]|uniref:Uncharacterized protein n=1 Tax=Pseudocohnilembus persalinus TaxID=266149 RepID=A0A0V0QX98_PSEPJ|nr:hypothetical protein PPERSA_07167 [Pseudocohnilembus persalinus]|eukprot:KRX07004.1 hypothetical protein PPERSA_07167 [Pseudocohnilembus persalinus]
MASDQEDEYGINGDQEDDNQDPHFPEVERDRSDYIQFLLKKFKDQIPDELKDIQKDKVTKVIKKNKEFRKKEKTQQQIYQEIQDIFAGVTTKIDKKIVDKKKKDKKQEKTGSDNEDNKNEFNENNEYEDMSYNELYNKSDDEIYQSGGNDEQYDDYD